MEEQRKQLMKITAHRNELSKKEYIHLTALREIKKRVSKIVHPAQAVTYQIVYDIAAGAIDYADALLKQLQS